MAEPEKYPFKVSGEVLLIIIGILVAIGVLYFLMDTDIGCSIINSIFYTISGMPATQIC